LWWAGATVAAAAILMFCYLRIAGTTPVVSDGAGNALEAWDMLHGNVLLHGWWGTDVSFWTTQLPILSIIDAVAGLRIEVVHISAAITYLLLVGMAAFAAKGRAAGAEAVGRVLLAVGIMLAPELGAPAYVVLGSPDHLGAAGLPTLLMVLLLDWLPRRWWGPVLTGLLLTWGLLGDDLVLIDAVVPLVTVCLVRVALALHRSQASARAMWYEITLVAVGVLSMFAARAVLALTAAAGGFQVSQFPGYGVLGIFYSPRMMIRSMLSIFGADPGGSSFMFENSPGGVPGHPRGAVEIAFALAHLPGVVLVGVGVLLAGRRLVRSLRRSAVGRADLVSDLMVTAIALNVVMLFFFLQSHSLYIAEEVAPVLPLGAALAGRELGGPLARAVLERAGNGRNSIRLAAAATAACYCAMLGYAAAQPQLPPGNAVMANWLIGHGLRAGIAGNWQASSIMLDTGGRVTLGSVVASEIPSKKGRISPYQWQADMDLLNPATHGANFLLIAPGDTRTRHMAVHYLGTPAATYRFDGYVILIWHRNLLRTLGPGVFR
jgi:hypothetical protein